MDTNKIKLTKREKQVLVLLSKYKSPKEISTIISSKECKKLAPATVSSIINKKLYHKFEVNCLSKLMEKSIDFNYI